MWKYNNTNELYHYGVPGMRWGVRNYQNKLSKIESRSKKESWSDDATEAYKIKAKKVKQRSNAEIRKLIERRQLEQNYSNLNTSAVKKGIAFVTTASALMGTAITIYNNSNELYKIGKKIVKKFAKK